MAYVINVEDGAGREWFVSKGDTLIPLDSPDRGEPLICKTHKQVDKQRALHSAQLPCTCQVYALDKGEFEERWQELKQQPTSPN